MRLTQLVEIPPTVVFAAMFSLAACGGGSQPPAFGIGHGPLVGADSSNTMQPPSAPYHSLRHGFSSSSTTPRKQSFTDYSGLYKAATSIPRLGRRSVTQSSNKDRYGVTTDSVEATFDRGQSTFTITREEGTSITLDSGMDTVSIVPGTPIRRNQISSNWNLEKAFSDHTMTVHSFGEIPDRDFPLRAIHAFGNYGTNMESVNAWEASGRTIPLVAKDYIDWLKSLHVNQVGLSIALRWDDSMDSTLERVYSVEDQINTFSDDAIRQFVREFGKHGIDVYLTLALRSEAYRLDRPVWRWQLGDPGDPETGVPHLTNILPENWPWRPDHPDHARFAAEFWETYTNQAVHFARIAEEEGVKMFSLGTETDNLFRTRSGGHYFPNHFRQELQTMVREVREVYGGILTYDMHYTALTHGHHFGIGSNPLWEDLGLDVVGVSAYFEMTDTVPSNVISVEDFEKRYEEIFQQYLLPLADRNPGRPIVFLEYGAIDTVASPAVPGDSDFSPFVFQDLDGNGLDDGREMQANMYQALINTMSRYPGTVNGILWTENWIASDQKWAEHWGMRRGWSIRNKPSKMSFERLMNLGRSG